NPTDAIALIAEWDTLYGQDMFRVVKDVFADCVFCSRKAGSSKNIQVFTYFQGIDGRLPSDKQHEQSDDKKNQDSTIWKDPLPGRPGTAIPAVGHARIDYLRRTVEELMRENSNWKAIGVVGSDVYDKILLIRILRYYFPGTILFTTDLDARLLDPAEYPSTHNLLIASHYGLELRRELQRDISPFRSIYETSQYFATLRAVWDARVPDLAKPSTAELPRTILLGPAASTARWENGSPVTLEVDPAPLVFEVGRTGPFAVGFARSGKD